MKRSFRKTATTGSTESREPTTRIYRFQSWVSRSPKRVQVFVVALTIVICVGFLATSWVSTAKDVYNDATIYRANEQKDKDTKGKIAIVKAELQQCVEKTPKDDRCLPKLTEWRNLIDEINGRTRVESDDWYAVQLWLGSINTSSSKAHDRTVLIAETHGYIKDKTPYLTVNDPDHSKFRKEMRKLIDANLQ